MSDLTAAVVGTGFIGPVHVEGLRRAGVHVAGILGSTAEKSAATASRLGIEQGFESFDQLLADPKIDVVHITSPNRHHFQQASDAIAAGKHVLCEKPLAMNSRQSLRLVELAAKSGVAAGVNYNIRYYPLCIEAAERVRAGVAGDLFHITGSYAQDWLFHPSDFNWRILAEEGGNLRAVADIGTHWLDLIQYITEQKVTSVCADLSTVYPQRQQPLESIKTFVGKKGEKQETNKIDVNTEDYGCVMLKMGGGARGVMWVSQVTAGRKNCLRFELAGSRQSISWDSQMPNELQIGHRDRANERLIRDPALLDEQAVAATSYPGGHNEGFGDSFKQLFRDFYSSIESGEFARSPSYPTFADGHHEILVCEAILTSHQQQSWITIGESTR